MIGYQRIEIVDPDENAIGIALDGAACEALLRMQAVPNAGRAQFVEAADRCRVASVRRRSGGGGWFRSGHVGTCSFKHAR